MLPLRKSTSAADVLRLPPMDEQRVLGIRVVQRATSIMLLVFGCAVALMAIVAALVTVRVTVDGAGLLQPARVLPVRSSQEGVIRHVLVRTGDTVHANQPLLVLDSLDVLATLQALQAQYREQGVAREQLIAEQPVDWARQLEQRAQADAHLERALATLRERMVNYRLGQNIDSLLAAHVPGQHVGIDVAVADVRQAQSEQRSADAEQRRLENSRFAVRGLDEKLGELETSIAVSGARISRLVVRAPADGVVLTDQVDRLNGAYVRPGDIILEVGDPMMWTAELMIRESELHQVHRGDSASVEIPALEELRLPQLTGVVVFVAESPVESAGQVAGASSGQSSGLYRVVVALDARPFRGLDPNYFRRGYAVKGKVTTRRGRILMLVRDNLIAKVRARGGALR